MASESSAAVGIEAVDGLDEPERGDLDEIVDRLAGVAEAEGQAAGQRHEPLREVRAQARVTGAVELTQATVDLPPLGRVDTG